MMQSRVRSELMVLQFNLSEGMVEEINEQHVSNWNDMVRDSKPPVIKSPLSAYMDENALQKKTIAFSSAKIKNIIGYTLKRPYFDATNLTEVIDKWK